MPPEAKRTEMAAGLRVRRCNDRMQARAASTAAAAKASSSHHMPQLDIKPRCTLSAAASTGIPLRFCLHFLAPRVKTAPSEWSAGRAGGVLWARERGALPEPAARWSPPRSFKHPLESSARCHRARRPPVKVCRRRPPAACRPPAPTTCARLASPVVPSTPGVVQLLPCGCTS